jgi:hypothetical protein
MSEITKWTIFPYVRDVDSKNRRKNREGLCVHIPALTRFLVSSESSARRTYGSRAVIGYKKREEKMITIPYINTYPDSHSYRQFLKKQKKNKKNQLKTDS